MKGVGECGTERSAISIAPRSGVKDRGWAFDSKSEKPELNPLDDEEEEEEADERAGVHANNAGVDNASEEAEETEETGAEEGLGVKGDDTGVAVVEDDDETGVGVMNAEVEDDEREEDEDEDKDKRS